jgi:hypothetical protein
LRTIGSDPAVLLPCGFITPDMVFDWPVLCSHAKNEGKNPDLYGSRTVNELPLYRVTVNTMASRGYLQLDIGSEHDGMLVLFKYIQFSLCQEEKSMEKSLK